MMNRNMYMNPFGDVMNQMMGDEASRILRVLEVIGADPDYSVDKNVGRAMEYLTAIDEAIEDAANVREANEKKKKEERAYISEEKLGHILAYIEGKVMEAKSVQSLRYILGDVQRSYSVCLRVDKEMGNWTTRVVCHVEGPEVSQLAIELIETTEGVPEDRGTRICVDYTLRGKKVVRSYSMEESAEG